MKKVNIAEVKARFSEYVRRVEAGETIVIARHNEAVAEIRPVRLPVSRRRPAGLCAGEFVVPSGFDDPLPAEVLDAFEGR